MYETFIKLEVELFSYLLKEEIVLFPAMEKLCQGHQLPGTPDDHIECVIHKQEDAGIALDQIRELTNDFDPPLQACNTYRALFAGFADLDRDLHNHIRLENSVLFPAAKILVEKASASSYTVE